MSGCRCKTGLGNTGSPNCKTLLSYAEMFFLVPKFGSDGTLNKIDLENDTIDDAFITAKINAPDPDDRWYPTPKFVEYVPTQADAVSKEYDTGKKVYVRDGVESATLIFPEESSVLVGKLRGYRCSEFGAYTVSHDGNFTGDRKGDFLYPTEIDNNTWIPKFTPATPSAPSEVSVSFDFSLNHKDEDFSTILANDVAPVNFLAYEGRIDVNAKVSTITATSFKAKLFTDYGSALSPDLVEDLVIGDFVLQNVTDNLPVTILTAVESPEGTYTITFASQTSGDKLSLRPTKDGFDFTPTSETVITIP